MYVDANELAVPKLCLQNIGLNLDFVHACKILLCTNFRMWIWLEWLSFCTFVDYSDTHIKIHKNQAAFGMTVNMAKILMLVDCF